MGIQNLRSRKASTTPPAPKEEPEVLDAEAVAEPEIETEPEPEVKTKAVAKRGGGVLAALTTAPAVTAESLMALVEIADESDYEQLFPIVAVKGGESGGGSLDPQTKDEELLDVLPAGKRPVTGVFLAARLSVIGWPCDYEERGPKDGPCWSAAMPVVGEDAGLALRACKRYQFTGKSAKAKFDWNDGEGTGRPVSTVELLFWTPEAGLFVIRGQPTFTATVNSINALRDLLVKGKLMIAPVKLKVESKAEQGKNHSWKHYFFSFTIERDAEPLREGWEAFREDLDEELETKAASWVSCEDSPMTDSIRRHLKTAASL